jgi:iron complex outermembrane receptor protein
MLRFPYFVKRKVISNNKIHTWHRNPAHGFRSGCCACGPAPLVWQCQRYNQMYILRANIMKQTENHPLVTIQRSLLALAVAAAFPLQAAWAQDEPQIDQAKTAEGAEKKDVTQLETIVVTATRRTENIKNVPMSISTLKGERLDTLTAGGQDIRFLAARTPSLNVESDFGRSFPRFYIRGLGNTDFDLNASQPVGLVYDGVVQENPTIKGFPVFDVDQIEILRGPQGTLFGRNSPAGVIKFDSVKPTQKLEGYASFGFASFNAVNLEGVVNLPLNKEWAARLSVQSQHRSDRVFNPNPAPTHSFEGYDDTAARLQVLYKPNAKFSALFNVHGRNMNGSATLFRANIIKKGTNELVDNFRYNYYPTDGGNAQTLDTAGGSVTLKWELDGMTLHSITGYEKAHFYSRGDVDGGVGAGAGSFPGFIPFPAETADGVPDHHQFSQEFRVESNSKSKLQWIGGLYYFDEDLKVDSFNFDTFNNNKQQGYAVQTQSSKAWAVFGSANYAVTEQLKVRTGLRYTDDKKEFYALRSVNPFGGPQLPALRTNPKSTNWSWDVSATYELNKDTTVFSRIATGYRAPSIQGRILFGDTISVADQEKNLSGEIGINQELFNRRARLRASVFQYRIKDLQLTAGSGAVNQNRLVNAAKAEGSGFELDLQANLNENWRASFGTSYNDTKIKDKNLFVASCGGGCTPTNAAGPFPGTVRIDGNPLPRAPKWVANMTLRYSQPVGEGEFYMLTDWSYRDTYNFFLYEAKEYKGKSLTEGGLRAGYKWADGKYELAGYARNITNRVQLVGAIDFNNLTGIVNEPRTIGMQFKANF